MPKRATDATVGCAIHEKLLVALDETPASDAALTFSLSLASRFAGAQLTGVTVLDIGHLTAPEPMPIGGSHHKFKADLARLERAHAQAVRVRERFLTRCRTANIKGRVLMLEGNPAAEVRATASVHDIIVIGHDADLRGDPSDGLAATVEQVLKGNPRPLIVTPEDAKGLARVLIAYDGSSPATRALQIFTLLELARDCELHIVAVSPDKTMAQRTARQASDYLKLYDHGCDKHEVCSTADPAEVISDYAARVSADLLVMGAYGHRGWREALLGSCTTRLLTKCPTSLFIYH